MDEELRKALADFFDVGEFAELIDVKVTDLITAFPDEVEEALEDLIDLAGLRGANITEDDYSEEEE